MESPLDRIVTGEPVSKADFAAAEPELRDALLQVQNDLVGRDFSVLVVLAGSDVTGCEQAYELLHHWFDARYLRAEAFGAPTTEERQRPWLWRYWEALPPRGSIGVHLRGWPTFAVSQRVRGAWGEKRLERELVHLRRLEEMLVADGALVLKFWLHVPKKVVKKRLSSARKRNAWRVSADEEFVLDAYDDALPITERVLAGTESPLVPWTVVDGSDRRFRNLAVVRQIARVVRERLDRPVTKAAEPPPDRIDRDPETILDRIDMTGSLDDDYGDRIDALSDRLSELHREARARGIGAVIAFEGWDAAGKGGAIRHVTRAMDAPNYKIFPTAAPDERARAHHWLWRFWRHLPRDGSVAVFDRSWYGRVLVERIEGFARRDEWQRAFADIEDFEAQMVEHGCVVAKFFLHITPEEQMRRFEQRQHTSYKNFKITPEDWRNRERWRDYELAVDDMIARTDGNVPWNIVPANDKGFARVEILRVVCDAYEARLKSKD